jgi:glycosyltransferase involved in cell wall biosynthesis
MIDRLVSIVLPTYNGEQYLEQAIDSCLRQSYTSIELIIIDDASTDSTAQIISKFCDIDSRVIYVRHTENKRLPSALNSGFCRSNGQYLTWTSDDNLYKINAIATMVNYLEDHSDADGVYCDYTEINEVQQSTQFVRVARINNLLTLRNCVGPCFLYRRNVYDCVGQYAEDLFLAEDYDFWVRVTAGFHLEPLHQNLYIYRSHPRSLTWQYRKAARLRAEISLAKHLDELRWMNAEDWAIAYRSLLDSALVRNNLRSATGYFVNGCIKARLRFFILCMQALMRKFTREGLVRVFC